MKNFSFYPGFNCKLTIHCHYIDTKHISFFTVYSFKFDFKKHTTMKRKTLGTILLPILAMVGILSILALKNDISSNRNNYNKPEGDAGLTLPAGFNPPIIAANIGSAMHIAVTLQ